MIFFFFISSLSYIFFQSQTFFYSLTLCKIRIHFYSYTLCINYEKEPESKGSIVTNGSYRFDLK